MFTLMLTESYSANVLGVLSKPFGDLLIWDPVPHLLIDGLDERAATDVASS